MDQSERAERLKKIAVEMDSIVRDIGPKWVRLAHLRREAKEIIEQLQGAPDERD